MYKLTNNTSIIRIADGAHIPNDPANRDYAEYLVWLEAGNVPEPKDPIIIPIPSTISMAQAQLSLLAAGHLDDVEAAVSTMSRESQIIWHKSSTVKRGDPLVTQMAALLGLDEAGVDALFIAGSVL